MDSIHLRVAGAGDHEAILSGMHGIQSETEGLKSTGFGRQMWEWQYLQHKHGSMVVVAEEDNAICAYFHLLLLDLRYHGGSAVGAIIQDTATFASHRRRGIFSQMDGYALKQLQQQGMQVVYGFANALSLGGYQHNPAYTIMTTLPLYVCPMDIDGVLSERFHLGPFGKVISRATMPFYRALRVRKPALEPGEEVVQLDQFDAEVTPIARDFADLARVGIDRTAEYLNWRFVEKPTHEYTLWGLRRNGRLCAYVVTRMMTLFSTVCVIFMDFGCANDEYPALRRLMAARLAAARAQDGAGMGVTQGLHPFFSQLRQLGFVRVPERFVPRPLHFFSSALTSDVQADVCDPASWLVTLADWDVL